MLGYMIHVILTAAIMSLDFFSIITVTTILQSTNLVYGQLTAYLCLSIQKPNATDLSPYIGVLHKLFTTFKIRRAKGKIPYVTIRVPSKDIACELQRICIHYSCI
jgi:hypothetical protein